MKITEVVESNSIPKLEVTVSHDVDINVSENNIVKIKFGYVTAGQTSEPELERVSILTQAREDYIRGEEYNLLHKMEETATQEAKKRFNNSDFFN